MKKLLLHILLAVLLLAAPLSAQEKPGLPITPDDPVQSSWFLFKGEWLPDVDSTKIGPDNFKTLQNMRYTNEGIESIKGYSKINTTTPAAVMYSGFHFKKDSPVAETHVLVNADGNVYQNKTAIPSAGNFEPTALHTDAAGAGLPRFSNAPYGHVAYTNGKETMIWAGDEMPVAAFITSTAAVTANPTNPKDYTAEVNNNLQTQNNVAVIGGGLDSYTMLLMHMDEADGGTAFDDATGVHNPANNGNAQCDTDQAKFGISSGLFDGTGDYVSVAEADPADWNYAAGTLTLDFWVQFNSLTGQHCLYSQPAALSHVVLFYDNTAQKLIFSVLSAGVRIVYEEASWSPSASTWYHVAVIRGWGGVADDWAFTVDGTAIHTFTNAGTLPDIAASVQIGLNGTTVGFIDSGNTGRGIEGVNGAAVSAAQYKFANGSFSFNGANQQLQIVDHADFNFGSGEFTAEAFVRLNSLPAGGAYMNIMGQGQAAANQFSWQFYIYNNGGTYELRFGYSTNGVAITVVSRALAALNINTWYHFSVNRTGNNLRFWADGTQVGADADLTGVTLHNSTGYLMIGAYFAASFLNGFIDELRLSSTARYTVAFTPTTTPFTSDSNTKLLLRGDYIGLNGWLDEYRVSKGVARWTADFTAPVRPYSTAARTWLVGSPRQVQGVKYYVSHANAVASTLSASEWQGYSWGSLSITDGTDTGGISMSKTGSATWTNTGLAKLKFIDNRLLYWYQFSIDAGEADIYRATLDAPWQNLVDIWDGVYRQPIQFQAYKSAKYQDYTLEVNEPDPTYYGDLGGLTNAEHLILMFDDRTTALIWRMVASKENTTAATATIYYWDGVGWYSVGQITDTTLDSATGTKSLGQSGHISWNPPNDEVEFRKTSFGTPGYAYKIVWSATLTAGNAQVNTVYGIPVQKNIRPYAFPAIFKDRLLLCGYTEGGEGNRCDYSMTHSAQVFNGAETSNDGLQSLYFGGSEDLKAGAQLYNRMGSNIFIFFLALKDHETYVLTGDGPEDFKIYPVSLNIGCPAPYSLVTAEMGFEIAKDVERHAAIWLSYTGPVIFDGAVIYQIPGIRSYFDPAHDNYVGASAIQNAFAWFDNEHKEYNLRVSTYWFVYDMARKRWYEKNTGAAVLPSCALVTKSTDGNQYNYAGTSTGYILRLENGYSWSGTNINHVIESGDFWPSNSPWDIALINRFKYMGVKDTDAGNITITHYLDGATSGPTTIDTIARASGTGRFFRDNSSQNLLGWSHRFRFAAASQDAAGTTDRRWKPLGWGYQWTKQRDDR